jgi:hypothetical protein
VTLGFVEGRAKMKVDGLSVFDSTKSGTKKPGD